MVNYNADQKLSLIFHALSDSTRREILSLIAKKPYRVTELAQPFNMSLAAISKHLKVLESAGLLRRTKEGRIHYCRLNSEPLLEVAELINRLRKFWEEQFASLEEFLVVNNSIKLRRNEMTLTPLVLKKTIPAPQKEVFEAWSNPEILRQWFKPDAKWQSSSVTDFAVGGSYEHTMTAEDGKTYTSMGEFKEIIPYDKLVFTWSADNRVEDTLVTVEFTTVEEGHTELTLVHDLLPDTTEQERHNQGWEGCLNSLIHYFENK